MNYLNPFWRWYSNYLLLDPPVSHWSSTSSQGRHSDNQAPGMNLWEHTQTTSNSQQVPKTRNTATLSSAKQWCLMCVAENSGPVLRIAKAAADEPSRQVREALGGSSVRLSPRDQWVTIISAHQTSKRGKLSTRETEMIMGCHEHGPCCK